MTKKILTFIGVIALLAGFATTTHFASAQSTNFPSGCNSQFGFSSTTGAACSGTGTVMFAAGCNSIYGTNSLGAACSGTGSPVYLPGCVSTVYGFSSVNGVPCNGTTTATFAPTGGVITPGLPTTGAGAAATINLIILAGLAMFAVATVAYVVRIMISSEK